MGFSITKVNPSHFREQARSHRDYVDPCESEPAREEGSHFVT